MNSNVNFASFAASANSPTTLEKTGRSVEEALQSALDEWGVSINDVESEILETPSKGLFGLIGNKMARVRVTLKKRSPIDTAQIFLKQVFAAMKLNVDLEVVETDESVTLDIKGEDLGVLIGKHGQTLDALQYLTNLAANRDAEERVRIQLDVEDYRKRRTETLNRLALRLADKVKRRGEKVVLEPMSPQERKIIHIALQDDNRISTYSEGEEPFRKVVIALKR